MCMEDADVPFFKSITEVATCQYAVVIGVPKLCDHPLFNFKVCLTYVCVRYNCALHVTCAPDITLSLCITQ